MCHPAEDNLPVSDSEWAERSWFEELMSMPFEYILLFCITFFMILAEINKWMNIIYLFFPPYLNNKRLFYNEKKKKKKKKKNNKKQQQKKNTKKNNNNNNKQNKHLK